MHKIHVERELQVPLQKLWPIVRDFSNLSWFQAAEKVERVGEEGEGGMWMSGGCWRKVKQWRSWWAGGPVEWLQWAPEATPEAQG